eukprot:324338-Prymnesium_polylepis.1
MSSGCRRSARGHWPRGGARRRLGLRDHNGGVRRAPLPLHNMYRHQKGPLNTICTGTKRDP